MDNYQQPQAGWEWQQFDNERRLDACIGRDGDSEARHLALIDASWQVDTDTRYMAQVDDHLLQAQSKAPRSLPKPQYKEVAQWL